jgi:hypothetical protein
MKKRLVYHLTFVLGVIFTQSTIAAKIDYQLGVGLMGFNYAEYDDNNAFLDGDSGFIPGVLQKLKLDTEK